MNVALVTSLYRSEQYLPDFIHHASALSQHFTGSALTVRFIVVANDPTEAEQRHLADFAQKTPNVTVLSVGRETLYASWNRGVREAIEQGGVDALGFWNVDDVRTTSALYEGTERLASGDCHLVYFAHTVLRPTRFGTHRRTYPAIPFHPEPHRHRMKCGPFFLFSPSLYARVGDFDDRFRIAGDFDWCVRALDHTDFCPLDIVAGYFLLHGGNLSDSGNPLQLAEENIIHLKQSAYDRLVPVEPEIMRQTCEKWHIAQTLPAHIQQQLWGEGAAQRAIDWQTAKQRKQQRQQLENAIRFIPKQLVDRTGIRPLLAKLGIVKLRAP